MIRFLNLFAAFRDAVTARVVAEDSARREQNRADRFEERIAELQRELIDTHKHINDKLGQRFLNVRFWTDADPSEAPKSVGIPARQLARDVVQQQTHVAFENFQKFMSRNDPSGNTAA